MKTLKRFQNKAKKEYRNIFFQNCSGTGLSFRTRLSSRKWGMRNPWFDRLTMHPELVEGLDSRWSLPHT